MKVLISHKLSAWSQRSQSEDRLLRMGDNTVSRMKHAHDSHESCLSELEHFLCAQKISYDITHNLSEEVIGYDFVITVGGDGTLLYASHFIGPNIPVLAINSSPVDSVGYFCICNIRTMQKVLLDMIDENMQAYLSLSRMRVEVNGIVVTNRALNDALFCHTNPACMTRYFLKTAKHKPEEHASSGMWISTASGAHAAICSAGGLIMSGKSDNLQYLVREPYQSRGKPIRNIHGFTKPGDIIQIKSKIEDGKVYIDGPHLIGDVGRGSTLTLQTSSEPLTLCIAK